MSRKSVRIKRIVIEVLLQIIFFTSLTFAVYYGILDYPLSRAYKLLYIVAVVVLAYAARCYIKSSGLFLLSHIAFIIGGLVVGADGSDEESFVLALGAFIVVFVSFVYRKMRMENKGEGFNIAMALVFFIEYLSGYDANDVPVMEVAVWSAILFVVLYVIYLNYTRIENLMFMNSGTSNFPVKRIVATNSTIARIAAALVCLGMVVFYSGPFGNIFVIIKNVFLRFLGWLLSFLLKGEGAGEKPSGEPLPTEETQGESHIEFDPVEVNLPLRDFLNALFIIIAIAIIVVAVFLIVRAFIKAFSYIGSMESAESDVIEDIEDKVTAVDEATKKKDQEISDSDLNLRARKLYKKQVKSVKKEKGVPKEAALAKDITKMFESGENADEITRVYEKARYSDETVTKEEVNVIKKST